MLCLNNGCKYRGYFVKNQKKKQKKEKKLNLKSKDTACLIQHNVLSLRFQRVVFAFSTCRLHKGEMSLGIPLYDR